MADDSRTKYRNSVQRTLRTDIQQPYALVNWALGLTGESGEVGDLIKKVVFHGKPLDVQKLVNELGDVRWYLEALCIELGITIEEVERVNIEKLEKRYPVSYSHADAAERKDEK